MNIKHQCGHGPASLVVDELQIVSAKIEEPTDERHQQSQSDGTRVVGWPEDPNLGKEKKQTSVKLLTNTSYFRNNELINASAP